MRTKRWNYFRYLDGHEAFYNIRADAMQLDNLIDSDDHQAIVASMTATLDRYMAEWNDEMKPATEYLKWFENGE